MSKKIIAAAKDFGGANAILPVLKALSSEYEIIAVNEGALPISIKESGFEQRAFMDGDSISSLTNLIKHITPSLVLTGTSKQDPSTRQVIDQNLVAAAKSAGIKSVSVLDWYKSYIERFSNLYSSGIYSEKAELYSFFLPDKIAVMDNLAKEAMLNLGFDDSGLEITGNPAFDDYMRIIPFSPAEKKQERKELGISDKKCMIAWVSQPIQKVFGSSYGFNEKTALECFLSGLEREAVVLAIANPKRESIEELEVIVNRFPKAKLLSQGIRNAKRAILASDLLATVDSADFYFALCAKIPVVSVQPNVSDEIAKLQATNAFKGIIPVIKSSNQVESAINYVQSAEYRNKADIIYYDGKATERVVGLVKNLS